MKNIIYPVIALIMMSGCSVNSETNLIQYVDPLIGTGFSTTPNSLIFSEGTENRIQNIPLVSTPNGMTHWTPQTRNTEQKCVSPYYYMDSLSQGFRASHWLNGGCAADYGTFTIMPVAGKLLCQATERASSFSHDKEISTPAYYSVYLDDYRINAEMTAYERCAMFKFRYETDENPYIVIEINNDRGLGYIEIDKEKKQVRGYNPVHRQYRMSHLSANFSGYFVVEFDKEFVDFGTFDATGIKQGNVSAREEENMGAFVMFKPHKDETVRVKAGTSFTSMEGAGKNLQAEVPRWDFEKLRTNTERKWNQALSKIIIENASEREKTMFYTAMYHSLVLPRIMNDVDASYPAFSTGKATHTISGKNYYDDFSMWDIYRATLPLYCIIDPAKTNDFVNSFIAKYESGDWLPTFPIHNNYTSAMIGDHGIAFIGDAWCKGIRDFDMQKAYRAMRQNAFDSPDSAQYVSGKGRRALKSYLQYGYVPLQDPVNDAFHRREQVSRTLEYAYDDFVLAQVAKDLGKSDDYNELIKRARNWKNVMDPETKWARGRNDDGTFVADFDPSKKLSFITEGTPRHYTWYVPQDIQGLIDFMGKDSYIAKLDSMFTDNYYWHGNEPGHQTPFMFNWVGMPWKTQYYVRQIMTDEYGIGPGGLCGNEDAGQMSSWYIFASIGFYPVCPGTPYYAIASPSYPKTVFNLENGKKFTIIAHNASPENIYIQSATLDGVPYDKNFINHEDILRGATFVFEMGSAPNKNWASAPGSVPYSLTKIE